MLRLRPATSRHACVFLIVFMTTGFIMQDYSMIIIKSLPFSVKC